MYTHITEISKTRINEHTLSDNNSNEIIQNNANHSIKHNSFDSEFDILRYLFPTYRKGLKLNFWKALEIKKLLEKCIKRLISVSVLAKRVIFS